MGIRRCTETLANGCGSEGRGLLRSSDWIVYVTANCYLLLNLSDVFYVINCLLARSMNDVIITHAINRLDNSRHLLYLCASLKDAGVLCWRARSKLLCTFTILISSCLYDSLVPQLRSRAVVLTSTIQIVLCLHDPLDNLTVYWRQYCLFLSLLPTLVLRSICITCLIREHDDLMHRGNFLFDRFHTYSLYSMFGWHGKLLY